jgi:hypothetical protein
MVIVLHREFNGGSIGITLAGGADYESKEITVRDWKIVCNLAISLLSGWRWDKRDNFFSNANDYVLTYAKSKIQKLGMYHKIS